MNSLISHSFKGISSFSPRSTKIVVKDAPAFASVRPSPPAYHPSSFQASHISLTGTLLVVAKELSFPPDDQIEGVCPLGSLGSNFSSHHRKEAVQLSLDDV